MSLLSELLNDPDCIAISEAEFQNRIRKVLEKLYNALDNYIKEVDEIRSREKKNIWLTAAETYTSRGRAEVCARIKTILDEIVERPMMTDDSFDIIRKIKKKKNEIVDNELSNLFRGTKDYHRLFKFEGKCADALENEWTYAFLLGLDCKDRVTEEQKEKIWKNEKKIVNDLECGMYDKKRLISDALSAFQQTDTDRMVEYIKNMIPKEDNPHYDEIIDFLTKNN